jgi:HEAT repeat protein
VAIRRSASSEIERLTGDLATTHDIARQAALARLIVIGSRAVGRLVEVAQTGAPQARIGALTALEAIGDPRAVPPALSALRSDDEEVTLAAMPVARRFLRGEHGAALLDALAAVVLDPGRLERVRLAALDTLRVLPAPTLAPLLARLRDDPLASLRQAAVGAPRKAASEPAADLERAARGGLPAEPEEVTALLADADRIPLSTLHRLVLAIREREARELTAGRRRRWLAARANVHRALARRKSRVALYDLRETLEQADTGLPDEFVEAVAAIGDASCLEPLVDACARIRMAGGSGSGALERAIGAAFRSIVGREHVSARHVAFVRLRSRWPDLLKELRGPGRAEGTRQGRK